MSDEATQEKRQIVFRYGKSPLCRVIHVDGAWGGLTPRGDVHMALYSEHRPLPSHSTYEVGPDSRIEPEKLTEESNVNIREVEIEAILTYAGAVALRDWLDGRIKMIETVREEIESIKTSDTREDG